MLKIAKYSKHEVIFLSSIVISALGDSMIPIAFALSAVELENSGYGFTAVLLSLWGARLFGSVLYRRYGNVLPLIRTMIYADVIRFLAQFILGIWVIAGYNSILSLCISSCIYGLGTSFFVPSRYTLTPTLVAEDILTSFNAFSNFFTDAFGILAPAVSTFIYLVYGFPVILFIDSATFMVGIFLLIFLMKAVGQNGSTSANDHGSSSGASSLAKVSFPRWIVAGIAAWSLISLALGFSGAEGPHQMISRLNEGSWAAVATSLALGSITGSASTLMGVWKKVSWRYLAVATAVLLGLQVYLYGYGTQIIVIFMCTFAASLTLSAAAVSWDVKVQTSLEQDELQSFANIDSIVSSVAVPLGMLLYGIGGIWNISHILILLISILVTLSGSLFLVTKRT